MGSLRAKQGSYIEILKAIQSGGLQGLTRPDRLLASQIWNTLNKMEYDPDLKLYLPFDETSGVTAHDLSGNGNTGTANVDNVCDGVFGKARNFDGTDDYVDCGNGAGVNPTSAITISAWVKSAASQTGMIVSKLNQTQYRLYKNPDDTLHYDTTIGGAEKNLVSVLTLGTQWHLTTVTYDGANVQMYFDGRLEDTTPASGSIGTCATHLHIGNQVDGYNFDGIIDEVRLYSRALTADEIYLHYLAGALKLGLI